MNEVASTDERPKEVVFCVSTHELNHLTGSPYEAACTVIAAVRKKGLDGGVIPGGLHIFAPTTKVIDAAIVLGELGIDITRLADKTFAEQLQRSGSLETLVAADPMGFGAKLLKMIIGTDTN